MNFEKYYLKEEKEIPELILPIGISGSGKSTYISTLNKNHNYVVVSPDEIRKEICGDVNCQNRNSEVWKIAKERVVDNLKKNKSVILDATNVNTKNRRAFIKDLPDCKLIAKILNIDPAIAKQRIQQDIKKGINRSNTPSYAIDRMYDQFKQTLQDIKHEDFKIIN